MMPRHAKDGRQAPIVQQESRRENGQRQFHVMISTKRGGKLPGSMRPGSMLPFAATRLALGQASLMPSQVLSKRVLIDGYGV